MYFPRPESNYAQINPVDPSLRSRQRIYRAKTEVFIE